MLKKNTNKKHFSLIIFKQTDGDSAVGAEEVDVGVADGAHPDVVVSPAQERGECRAERDAPVPGRHSYRYCGLRENV